MTSTRSQKQRNCFHNFNLDLTASPGSSMQSLTLISCWNIWMLWTACWNMLLLVWAILVGNESFFFVGAYLLSTMIVQLCSVHLICWYSSSPSICFYKDHCIESYRVWVAGPGGCERCAWAGLYLQTERQQSNSGEVCKEFSGAFYVFPTIVLRVGSNHHHFARDDWNLDANICCE